MNDNILKIKAKNREVEQGKRDEDYPLIKTKIQIPIKRPDHLVRPRLINYFHAHLDRKLIVVSAPAGYGKTSLLIDFANDTDLPTCWYTIDSYDKDLRVFLEYLIASIAQHFPEFGQRSRKILRQTQDPESNIYPIVATIVQEIHDKIPEYFLLVLDDHHTVESIESINEFLDLFVSYIDENCHLFLLSRSLPALPNFSLLIARRQAAGLGIEDLRFTTPEIQTLGQQNHNLHINVSQADKIAHRTGGWITGLQLMGADKWKLSTDDEYLDHISPHIYDYLSKQVLNEQPPELQQFMLASSVFDEISIEICADELGLNESENWISQIRSRNIFVIEYDTRGNRLRYHDLFLNFLRTTLQSQGKNRFYNLTQQAADYYVKQGDWERAISRYRTLGDHASVANILDQIESSMYDSGRWNTLIDWIEGLPRSLLESRPQLIVQCAKIYAERGEYTVALKILEHAENLTTASGDTTKAAYILAIKGGVLRFQGHYHEAIEQCQGAFALALGDSMDDKMTSAMAHKNIGTCLIQLGQVTEGKQALNRALHIFEELDSIQNIGMIHHDLGLSLEYTGDLQEAIRHYRIALECWEQLGNLSPWANTLNGLGVIFQQLGDYERANELLHDSLEKSRLAGDIRIESYALTSLADLYRAQHSLLKAKEFYTNAIEIAQRAHIGFIITYSLDGLANIARVQGETSIARNLLNQAMARVQEYGSMYEKALCHISLGVLENELGDMEAACLHLNKAIEISTSNEIPLLLARACLHRAHGAYSLGKKSEALQFLDTAFANADRLGFNQFFIAEGRHLAPLFSYALTQGMRRDHVQHLLDGIQISTPSAKDMSAAEKSAEPQPTLKIFALGQPTVSMDGEIVQWPVAKSRDLFFYLLQNPKGKSKEQIGITFWPDHGPERLDSAFRSTIYRLRRVVYRDCIVFESGLYKFNWDSDYWFDANAFEVLLNDAERNTDSERNLELLEKGLELYRGDYLQGVYHDWVVLERERLRVRYLNAIEKLAGIYVEQRKLQQAIILYKRLVKEDPFQETAHRELMRCYYRQGDRAAAIRQYHSCVEMLREELDLMPSKEIEDLYLQIIK